MTRNEIIHMLKALREAVIEDENQELTDNCRENAVYSIEDLIEVLEENE